MFDLRWQSLEVSLANQAEFKAAEHEVLEASVEMTLGIKFSE